MLQQKNNFFDYSLFKYLVVGFINTVLGLLLIYTLKWFFGMSDVLSNMIGYMVGICVAYTLNGSWVFRYSGYHVTSVPKFIFVIFVAYSSNLYTVLFLIEKFEVSGYLAQAVGIAPYTLIGYIGNKYFVFKNKHSY